MSWFTDQRDSLFGKVNEKVGVNIFDVAREKADDRPAVTTSGGGEAISPSGRESYGADTAGSGRPATDQPTQVAQSGGLQANMPLLVGGGIILAMALFLKAR